MKAKTIVLLLALLLLISTACSSENNTPEPQPHVQSNEEITPEELPLAQPNEADTPTENSFISAQDIGEGAKAFRFEATDGEGNVNVWNVHTNAATVGDALVEAGLIEGDVSDFGLMVSHVNGIRADFMEDNAYWAFYVDGEFAMVGVDSTDIEEGVTYAFIYTPA